MPGQRGSENRQLTHQILVRVTAEMHERISAAAGGESLPSFTRELIAAALYDLDDSHVKRSRRRRPVVPDQDLAELGKTARGQRRLNGAVVQLTKLLRELGSDRHPDVELVLTGLRNLSRQLDSLVMSITDTVAGKDRAA